MFIQNHRYDTIISYFPFSSTFVSNEQTRTRAHTAALNIEQHSVEMIHTNASDIPILIFVNFEMTGTNFGYLNFGFSYPFLSIYNWSTLPGSRKFTIVLLIESMDSFLKHQAHQVYTYIHVFVFSYLIFYMCLRYSLLSVKQAVIYIIQLLFVRIKQLKKNSLFLQIWK